MHATDIRKDRYSKTRKCKLKEFDPLVDLPGLSQLSRLSWIFYGINPMLLGLWDNWKKGQCQARIGITESSLAQ
jgi:hypothetical protein